MLPPIPHSLVPVTATQDVIKPKPDIPPVTPAEESAEESALSLEKRHPQEAEELREEQRRRQRRGYTAEQMAEAEPEEVEQALGDLPRQGLWVDVEV